MIADKTKPLQLCFIRHGETAWSLSGQHTGRTDIPLTAHGEEQARDLKPFLEKIRFSHVLTSPRQRAQRTCALAGLEAAAEIDADLSEWDYGDYEGRRSVEIFQEHPHWSVFKDGCPNGESPSQMSDRIDRLIARLQLLDGNVALFAHGHFGSVLATRWIGLPVAEGEHFHLGTASLSILAYNPRHANVRVIKLWNASPASLAGN